MKVNYVWERGTWRQVPQITAPPPPDPGWSSTITVSYDYVDGGIFNPPVTYGTADSLDGGGW